MRLLAVNTGTVDLWHCHLLTDGQTYQNYLPFLSADERNHAGQLSRPLLQQRYVEVRGHLRRTLAHYLDMPPEQINIQKTAHGKPYLADFPNLAFNLSHTGAYLVIAVSTGCRLGVDIERIKPRLNLPQLVAKCFAEDEAAYWHSLPETEKTLAFYRLWTQKEAFVKATGRGIALGLKHCAISLGPLPHFVCLPDEHMPTSQWQILEAAIPSQPSVCCAVVIDSAAATIELRRANV